MKKQWFLAMVMGMAAALFAARGDESSAPSTGTGDATPTAAKPDENVVTDNQVEDTNATTTVTNADTTELKLESPDVSDNAEDLGDQDEPDSPEALDNPEDVESPDVRDTSRSFPLHRCPATDEVDQAGVGVGVKW